MQDSAQITITLLDGSVDGDIKVSVDESAFNLLMLKRESAHRAPETNCCGLYVYLLPHNEAYVGVAARAINGASCIQNDWTNMLAFPVADVSLSGALPILDDQLRAYLNQHSGLRVVGINQRQESPTQDVQTSEMQRKCERYAARMAACLDILQLLRPSFLPFKSVEPAANNSQAQRLEAVHNTPSDTPQQHTSTPEQMPIRTSHGVSGILLRLRHNFGDGRLIEAQCIKTSSDIYWVLAGSQISMVENTALREGNKKIRRRRRKARIVNGVLQKNEMFDKPSSASAFVCGTTSDGYVDWRTEDGRALGDYLERRRLSSFPSSNAQYIAELQSDEMLEQSVAPSIDVAQQEANAEPELIDPSHEPPTATHILKWNGHFVHVAEKDGVYLIMSGSEIKLTYEAGLRDVPEVCKKARRVMQVVDKGSYLKLTRGIRGFRSPSECASFVNSYLIGDCALSPLVSPPT